MAKYNFGPTPAALINTYWLNRGFDPQARMHTIVIPVRGGGSYEREIVVSNMRNGYPAGHPRLGA